MSSDFRTSGKEFVGLSEETERQSKELTDSIKYASYIQSALLPSKELFDRLLPENFIFFKPRATIVLFWRSDLSITLFTWVTFIFFIFIEL